MRKNYIGEYKPTVRDTKYVRHTIMGEKVNVIFHDTAGQRDFSEIRKEQYKSCHPSRTSKKHQLILFLVVLFCYSCVNRVSLKHLSSYWAKELHEVLEDFTPILVGLKSDWAELHPNEKLSKSAVNAEKRRLHSKESFICSAREHCGTDGLKGNIDNVFKSAFATHILRELEVTEESCKCNLQIAKEAT